MDIVYVMLSVSYLLFNIVRYCHFVTFPLIHKSKEIQRDEVHVLRLVNCVHLGCGQCDAEGLIILPFKKKTVVNVRTKILLLNPSLLERLFHHRNFHHGRIPMSPKLPPGERSWHQPPNQHGTVCLLYLPVHGLLLR